MIMISLTSLGVGWENCVGVKGHSDGDVVAHAICDAILSACRLGDLGLVFGVDDPDIAGISGQSMLEKVIFLANDSGWLVENVSVQLVAQKPKVTPKANMRLLCFVQYY